VTSIPRPGRRVRGSRTGRPIMALIDLLGRRWTLRVVWELRAGRLTFRALQDACDGVSPTVLNDRLRELRETRLIDLAPAEGYGLTTLGRELITVFLPLVEWSKRWARTLPADAVEGRTAR
jgi:DNA-binding HxlR family transcriptional regulator